MKIAFLFDVCFKKYNGRFYSINLSKEFWESRYLPFFDEIVVVGRYSDANEEEIKRLVRSDSENVKFKCIQNSHQVKRIVNLKKEYDYIEKAIDDCDAVITRGWWGAQICQKLKKPYLFEVIVDSWDSLWFHSLIGKMLAFPYDYLQKISVKKADYTLYVTNKYLQKRYPTNGKNIGCSDVSLDSFDSNILNKRINHIKTHSGKMILGTTAAVNVRYKGQEFVIQALAILKKIGITNFEYQLVGNGDYSYLKDLAKKLGVIEQVKFLGGKPHEQVFDWLDSIDIYIQPSLQEGLPRALVEAQSRALPCLGSSTGGIPELLPSDCIFDKKGNKPQAIADWLITINQGKLLKYAENNFKEACKYQKEVLDKKRKKFYMSFKTYVERRNGATN